MFYDKFRGFRYFLKRKETRITRTGRFEVYIFLTRKIGRSSRPQEPYRIVADRRLWGVGGVAEWAKGPLTWIACHIYRTWTACRPADGHGDSVRGAWDRPNGNGNFGRTGRTGTVSRRRRLRRGRVPVARCAARRCAVLGATWTGNPPSRWRTGSDTGWPPRRWNSRTARSGLVVGAPSTATPRTFLQGTQRNANPTVITRLNCKAVFGCATPNRGYVI